MIERRRRRATHRPEALRILLESVRDRSDISAIAVVDSRGLVIAGAGEDRDLVILGTVAAPVAAGSINGICERLTEGTDVFARAVDDRHYLAALGDKVSRMTDATRAVKRILAA